MSQNLGSAVAVIGIDIGKNSFHVVELDRRGVIVLRCTEVSQQSVVMGPVSRVTPVHTAMRNCTGDEGRSFEIGNQVLISSHRKLLSSKDAMGPATRQL